MSVGVLFIVFAELAAGEGAVVGFPRAKEVRVAVALAGDEVEFEAALETETGEEGKEFHTKVTKVTEVTN